MIVTEVRIELADGKKTRNGHLKAFGSLTFDDMFVVHELKIIEGVGGLFVAMPDRELTDFCYRCRHKTRLRDCYCARCGTRLDENRAFRSADGRVKLHADTAHPINAECREMVQSAVLQAYAKELELAKQPGYHPRYEDLDEAEAGDPHNR
jgi:stage V sporulation protein G